MKILKFIETFKWMYLKSPLEYAKHIGVKVGKDCEISSREFPSEGYLVEIGDHVRIAAHASFYTHGAIVSLRKLMNDPTLDQFGKIKIGDYTSIGAYAMVMPGVTIGRACIVAGGAVVTKSVPDGYMVAGNPARIIGKTEDFYKKVKEKNNTKTKGMSDEEKKKALLAMPDDIFIKKGYMKIPEGLE